MDIQNAIDNNWNTNMEEAPKFILVEKEYKTPKGIKIKIVEVPVNIWVTDGNIVTKSNWVKSKKNPINNRWNLFSAKVPPIAWQPFYVPSCKLLDKSCTT